MLRTWMVLNLWRSRPLCKTHAFATLVTIICLAAFTKISAQAIELGVTFTHFKLKKDAIEHCSTLGQSAPLMGGAVIPSYHFPDVRTKVQAQLAAIRQGGFETLRTIVWFTSRPSNFSNGQLASNPSLLDGNIIGNVSTFAKDIARAQFRRWTVVFGGQGHNSPHCRHTDWGDCFDPALTEENWNFISKIYLAIAASTDGELEVEYDLANEACPSRYLKPLYYSQRIQYLTVILSRFIANYGKNNARISCAGLDPERLTQMIAVYRSVGMVPKYADIHTYEGRPQRLLNGLLKVDDIASTAGMKLVLGEMFYHSETQLAGISSFTSQRPGRIVELIQWPHRDLDNRCSMDVEPPFTAGDIRQLSTQK